MPNANTYKVGRTPMRKVERYEGPIAPSDNLVYFTISKPDQRDARIGSKPAKLQERMDHWASQGWAVRLEKAG